MARETLVFISILILFALIRGETLKCIQKSSCSCEYEDGKIIDLHKLDTFLFANNGNITYYFHACSDSKPEFPTSLNITLNECSSTSLCLLTVTNITANTATAVSLGQSKDVKFSLDGNAENCLVYDNSKYNKTTVISLACSYYPETVLHYNLKTNTLMLFSPSNCAYYEEKGLSTGSVLVIILIVFSSVYFFGGAAVLHFLRGARGKEMIPNIDFWTDLPCLVKDGAVFLQNGCKPVISASESYDRI